MKEERLDKLLRAGGVCTRSQARSVILSGAVTVDGAVVRRPEAKVAPGAVIRAGGRVIDTAEFVYCMMNKPAGYISGSRAERYPPVTALLSEAERRRGLFCAGRLDADVTGLLLLTDDGAYAHRVTAPRGEIPKTYAVLTDGPLTEENVRTLAAGVTLRSGETYRPARLAVDGDDPCRGLVTVTEGKYHEVKNLLAVCGRRVVSMSRISIGGLVLDKALQPGEYRRLTEAEAQTVFRENEGGLLST